VGVILGLGAFAGLSTLVGFAVIVDKAIHNAQQKAIKAAGGYIDVKVEDPDDPTRTKTVSVTIKQAAILQEGGDKAKIIIEKLFQTGTELSKSVKLTPQEITLLQEGSSESYVELQQRVNGNGTYLTADQVDDLMNSFKRIDLTSNEFTTKLKSKTAK
ncbi:MAG: hypothetical protein OXE99_14715, partial [Cellvibrionales bacterium]|nr:hypothetical protein [Cellvibrionales bacterium]